MKKILLICLGFLVINPMFSQKKNITLDDLWKNYSFFPKNYNSLNSMNNGEHYEFGKASGLSFTKCDITLLSILK